MHSRQRKYLFFGVFLLIMVGGAICYYYANRTQYMFPMWELATEEKPLPNVSAKLTGIDFDYQETPTDSHTDVIHVRYELNQITTYNPLEWWVDYYYNGEWYTVYRNARSGLHRPLCSYEHDPGNDEKSFILPPNVLFQGGIFRLFMNGYGYCQIDLT